VDEVIRLFKRGLSMREVSRRTGKSFTLIRWHLIRTGVHRVNHKHVREGTAVCNQCRAKKSVDEFPSLDVGKYLCRECLAAANQVYQLARNNCGVSEYERLFEVQQGRCMICGRQEGHRNQYGKSCRLAVDHDHTTGKVRGLLCNNCNRGLGRFKDSIELLEAAIRYLKREQTGSEKADHTFNC